MNGILVKPNPEGLPIGTFGVSLLPIWQAPVVFRFVENDPAVLRRLLTDTDTIAEVMGLAPSFSS